MVNICLNFVGNEEDVFFLVYGCCFGDEIFIGYKNISFILNGFY